MNGDSGRLEEIFAQALELEPERWAAFLDEACADEPALRAELQDLLRHERGAGEFFDDLHGRIASSAQEELDSAARPKIRIGPYRAVELLGQGGMGVVYLAERADGSFEQKVALKLLHLDLLTPAMQSRFLAERQLLASLSHPNIARLQDGGVTDEGRPYFVMEFVDGLPITRHVAHAQPSLDSLLGLFLTAIDAVSYLHRNLVVHRDLKPSNIFVDRDGSVKLLDFGIAKLLGGEGAVDLTVTADQLLTPRYAAPEQLSGSPVTTATDVYSLGLVLYELVAGRLPNDVDEKTRLTLRETVRPPSAALLEGPEPGGVPERQRLPWRRIPEDLDRICLKAIRPEPERRYASAEQLAEDIERYLEGLPVRARKSTLGYRARTFVRRYKAGVATAVALSLLLLLGFAREVGLRGEAEAARATAERESAKAVAISDFLTELLSSADPARAQGSDLMVSEVLGQAAERLEGDHRLEGEPEIEAAARLALGRTYMSLSRYVEARSQLERALELAGGLESGRLEAAEIAEALALAHAAVEPSLSVQRQTEERLRQVLQIRRSAQGDEHPETLGTLGRLARVLRNQGRLDEAERTERQVLASRRATLGEEHPDTLLSLNSVGGICFQGARYAEAAALYEQALGAAKRTLGTRHPETLRYGGNLGAAYAAQGLYREAEVVNREVVEGRVEVLGEEHSSTGLSLHNLCVVLLAQASYGEAEECLERALASRGAIGESHPGYLYTRSYLASLFREQGRYREAEVLYEEVYSAQVAINGAEWVDALFTRAGLAELYLRTGRVAAAEETILSVGSSQGRQLPPGHPDRIASALTLAGVRRAQYRPEEALELAERATAEAGRSLGGEHPVTVQAIVSQAEALRDLDRPAEAAALLVGAYDVRKSVLGERHPETAESLVSLVDAYEAAGDEAQARRYREARSPSTH